MKEARLALVCEGDAESADKSFSGTSKSLLDHLRLQGHEVVAVDAEVYGARRLLTAAQSFAAEKRVWRARFRLGDAAFAARSRRARAGLAALRAAPNVVLQIGATFAPPRTDRLPYVLYCDWNMALAERFRDSGQSPVQLLSAAESRRVAARERAVYEGARYVFTTTDKLRQSFIEDYQLPPERVVAAYAGPNLELARIPATRPPRAAGQPPTILFVGKEFERKGGFVMADAFAAVRRQLPDARLRIMGPAELPHAVAAQPGVELLGFLRKDDPGDFVRIVDAYMTADVFCLPSLYDPSPIAVVEAMMYGLPCVTSDTWAMPERVVDGETGHVAPTGDAAALADRVLRVLADEELARRMGDAGRQRARARFTWEAAARTISAHVNPLGRPA